MIWVRDDDTAGLSPDQKTAVQNIGESPWPYNLYLRRRARARPPLYARSPARHTTDSVPAF